jgi:hypothetical protein
MDILDNCIFILDVLKTKSNTYDLILPDWFDMFYKDLRNISITNNLFEKTDIYNFNEDKHQWVELIEVVEKMIIMINNDNNFFHSNDYINNLINKTENIKNHLKIILIDSDDPVFIKKELDKAIEIENYEYACLLRDKLINLNIITNNTI